MSDEHTLTLKPFIRTDPRLGRHKAHDSRSLQYRAPRRGLSTLKSVEHVINIGILDQGNIGSCTGYAAAGNLGANAYWAMSEAALRNDAASAYALGIYKDATLIDPWQGSYEPDDTGSDGLSVAKVLKSRGLISGYMHATSLDACLTALAERPVMIGSAWYSDMFEPSSTGEIVPTGNIEGGHEWFIYKLDVENKRVGMQQSWGPNWGPLRGRAWLTWNNLDKLLLNDGDCTILVPKSEPPPVPMPVVPSSKAEQDFAHAMDKYARTKGCPKYVKTPFAEWRKTVKE